ncbi:MAG: hypothetical protein AAB929_00860 [Patescibacteria group bacterium]
MKNLLVFALILSAIVLSLTACSDSNSNNPSQPKQYWYTNVVFAANPANGMFADTTVQFGNYHCDLDRNILGYYDVYNGHGTKLVSDKNVSYIYAVENPSEKHKVLPNFLVNCSIEDLVTDSVIYGSQITISLDGAFDGKDMYRAVFDYNETDGTYCFITDTAVGRVKYDGTVEMQTSLPNITQIYAKQNGLYVYYAIPKPGEYHTWGNLNGKGEMVSENKIDVRAK